MQNKDITRTAHEAALAPRLLFQQTLAMRFPIDPRRLAKNFAWCELYFSSTFLLVGKLDVFTHTLIPNNCWILLAS